VTARVPDHAYAGLISRVAALAIDIMVVTIGSAAVRVLPPVIWREVIGRQPAWLTIGSAALAAALPWAYFTLCWWLAGQTVGDMLLGIAVQRQNGDDPTLLQSALRAAVGLLLFPLWIIGLVAILWEPQRRAWHDRIFRTVVRYAKASRKAVPQTQ
jgi:uncharacterized RDD family membrane protein YckC